MKRRECGPSEPANDRRVISIEIARENKTQQQMAAPRQSSIDETLKSLSQVARMYELLDTVVRHVVADDYDAHVGFMLRCLVVSREIVDNAVGELRNSLVEQGSTVVIDLPRNSFRRTLNRLLSVSWLHKILENYYLRSFGDYEDDGDNILLRTLVAGRGMIEKAVKDLRATAGQASSEPSPPGQKILTKGRLQEKRQ